MTGKSPRYWANRAISTVRVVPFSATKVMLVGGTSPGSTKYRRVNSVAFRSVQYSFVQGRASAVVDDETRLNCSKLQTGKGMGWDVHGDGQDC